MATAVQRFVQDPSFEQQAAVRALVKAMQDAFNAKDAAALARNLGEDATWTNAIGLRARGRREIERLARTMMIRNARSFARYDIVDVIAVRPDVCVVNLLQVPTDRDGNEIEEITAAPSYVIAREYDGWKIVAGQNTLVASPEGA
ncbi:SgcJ/EcaC family oxidoreductase [Aquamicrobium sp. LC103]|uniref:YybH family protein n=1 Tax=Aquamicrobium sp. LC103 TaxID=1120658 RepID=UPI00063E77E9|nr:SgcJ/EcaC family oxidoreductase [Aquamicrobium sp. LC103]TKT77595.1 SgcJ/EcaC family oxidoreductase [Aquamicrobium sp. LC103]